MGKTGIIGNLKIYGINGMKLRNKSDYILAYVIDELIKPTTLVSRFKLNY